MVDYSERIAASMKHAGVSVSKLAAHLAISYQAVKKVVDGKSHAFTAENNAKAAAFLGVDPNWLATGKGVMLQCSTETSPPATVKVPTTVASTLSNLGDLLMQASPKTRAAAADLLSRYAQDPATGQSLAQAIELLLHADQGGSTDSA